MFLALYVGFLDFDIIILAVFSYNSIVGTCLEIPRYSRMEKVYFAALAPETSAIISASVEIVANVACSLLL